MDVNSIGGEKTMRGGLPGALGCIDQYEIVRELGEGGFGAVYLARDTVADVEVAIKGLPPEVKHNRAELENVKANFALVSRLHHPYIAAALHLHLAKATTYASKSVRDRLRVLPGDTMLVMEYAPGVTLDRWRRQFPGGVVPPALAANIAWQVAQALDFAHENHILHRDVKPANVMIETLADDAVTARLLDFGLAAEIRSSMGRVSREIRDTSGTRPYMAPEQWAGRRQTAATDQYALAVMLYELVVGEVPFASVFETGDPVIMMTVVTSRPVEIPADCPRRRSLAKALSKEGVDRYPSCIDFVQDFAKSECHSSAPPVEQCGAGTPPPAAPPSASTMRKPGIGRIAAAVVLVLLSAIGVAVYVSVRQDRLELAELSGQMSSRRQVFEAEYAKVDAYRLHPRTRGAHLSRIDELYKEMEAFAVPRKIDAARSQLRRMDEVVALLKGELVVLESDEKVRLEAERQDLLEKERQRKETAASAASAAAKTDRGASVTDGSPAVQPGRAVAVVAPAAAGRARTPEDVIRERMRKMMLPTLSFRPPATIVDVVDFFRGASKDYDAPDIPIEKRGFNFVLDCGMPDRRNAPIPAEITCSDISFYDALSTVCRACGFEFAIENKVVWVRPARNPVVAVAPPAITPVPLRTPPSRRNVREETLSAKRCAQNADWTGCYEHLAQADTNDCEIMYLYGVCFSSMHPDKDAGVKKNDKRAFNWFLRGSKRGDAPCQQNLGEACRRGVGTKKDLELALYWIRQSADKGNPYAVCSLAQMLEKGEGIDKDTEKAADLYALAAQKRVAAAENWLREHHDSDRYKKMVAKRSKSQTAEKTDSAPRSARGAYRSNDSGWTSRSRSSWPKPSVGGSGGSDAAVWGSVLGGVLTGLAIGLSAIH